MKPVLRALMVEDSEDDALLIQETIRSAYDLDVVRVDTESGLRAALRDGSWEIILSDYRLPSFDVREVLAIIREVECPLPVIVISGTVGEDVAVETLKLGAEDYLLKQNLTRLVPAVHRALEVYETRRQRRHLEHMKALIDDALLKEMNERRRVEEILHLAMRVAGMGAWSRDLDSGDTWISPSALALLGSPDDTSAVEIGHLARIAHPDDLPFVEEALAEQANTDHHIDFETRVLRPDGREEHLHVRSEIFRAADGTPQRRVGILEDITALRHAQIENQAFDERLHQAQRMEAIGTFAAGITHDFNNILTVFQTNAELIALDPAHADTAQDILHATRRARDLVEQILGFSGVHRAPRTPMDLRTPVSEAIRLLQSSVAPTVQLEVDLPERPTMIVGNATQLLRLVLNLGKNALQAMATCPSGVLTVRLTLGNIDSRFALAHPPLRRGPALSLTVQDTGSGMDGATVARIFEPFFSTKGAGGTGLGLALAQSIVVQHEGTILVDSTPGMGTTFTVWLPVVMY